MFFLQWQRKAIDDTAQDLEKFGDSIVVFRFINKPKTDTKLEHSYIKHAHKNHQHKTKTHL